MEQQKWNSFTRNIHINAPIDKLYDAWASSSGIQAWFLKEAIYVDADGKQRDEGEPSQVGDSYTWAWYNWPDKEHGKITQANGTDLYELTFADSVVTVRFSESNGMTLVSLEQHDIPQDDASKMKIYYGCGTGWTFWLTNLKAYMEHGVTLHETEKLEVERHTGMEYVNM